MLKGMKYIVYGVVLILFTIFLEFLVPTSSGSSDIVYVFVGFGVGIVLIVYGAVKVVRSGVKKCSPETKKYNQLLLEYNKRHGESGKRQLNQDLMKLIDEGCTKEEAIDRLSLR